LSFNLQRGEMVALVGPNGIGKSTLLKVITGQLQAITGNVDFGSHVKLGYYDQEHNILNSSNTVLEEVWSAYPHMEEVRIRTVLGNFLFSGEDVLKRISALSGGEKARVSLSKLMLAQANLLILDEPTNHLDLFSREVLEAALIDYEGTVLFISHDRYFLNKMAERIVELTPAGANYFLGNYDDMLEKKLEIEEAKQEAARRAAATKQAQAQETTSSSVQSYEVEKQQKRAERTKQRKLESLEAEIAKLEASITEWEEKLTDPAIFNDYMRIQEIQNEISALKQALESQYEQWEELMS